MMTSLASSSTRVRLGFTLVETLIVLAVLAIMVGALGPLVARQISHSRVNGAANVVVGDLEMALSLASRQRRPVRITVNAAERTLVIADRGSGQTLVQHAYGRVSEYKLETLSSSPATIDILPHGVATSAATVMVGIGGYSRRVTLTRAGQVRLQP